MSPHRGRGKGYTSLYRFVFIFGSDLYFWCDFVKIIYSLTVRESLFYVYESDRYFYFI